MILQKIHAAIVVVVLRYRELDECMGGEGEIGTTEASDTLPPT